MSKHTPGSWRWFVQGNHDVYLAAEHSGRLLIMDFVRKGMQSAIVRFRNHEQCVMYPADAWIDDWTSGTIEHPDARLIAAAPDLLAACEEFMGLVEAGECPDGYAANVARAAIARARGEER